MPKEGLAKAASSLDAGAKTIVDAKERSENEGLLSLSKS